MLGCELVPGLVIRKTVLRRYQPFIAADGAIHVRKECETFGNLARQFILQFIEIGDNLLYHFFIKIERRGHIIKYAEVIHDQAVGLARKDTIRAADGPAAGYGPSSACPDTSPAEWAHRIRSTVLR